ncbi:alpha/beta hydrolase [Candidatus Saccharibacteria bacterium]|nr:alpha/beta hydrolase [Candidatus Saccharibacteria bacterium]
MKYIILHGSFSLKDGNWFPWLRDQLESRGETVVVPQMPIGVGKQNFDSWSAEFDKLEIDEDTTIIAHSIGPVFVCKYLITKKIKVKKLIFVCGFNNYLGIDADYDAVNGPMFLDNLADIKKYCDDIVCFYSDDDPYVSYDAEKAFADTIATQQICIKGAGHINAERGYTEFKEILEVL